MSDIKFDIIARDRASRAFRDVASAADHSSSKLAAVAKYGALAAGGLVTLTAVAARFTYKVGSDYVDSLNKIQALTGANKKQMDSAAKSLERNASLYAKMGQTTGDAASGVVELTKAGLSLHDALKSVNATMVLAKAGELSVADASTLVANSLNTFGLKAQKAGMLANVLANAANISSADVTDLAESFKYVTPVAAAAGVSVQQTAAILAELSNSGLKASIAGTTLRTFLLNLEAPAGAAANVLDKLNVQVFDAAGNMKPLPDVIDQLAKALNGLPAQQKAADMKALFGKVGIAGATAILKGGADGLARYTKGVEKAGAASKLAQAKSKGLAGEFASIKAQVTSAAQEIYRKFSPALDKRLRDFIQQFKDGTGAGGKFHDALRNIGKIAESLWPAMKKTAEWTGTFLGYLASHKTELKLFAASLVALKGLQIANKSGVLSLGKSLAGKVASKAAPQDVFVTNWAMMSGAGAVGDVAAAAGGAAVAGAIATGVTIAAAAVAAGALAYIAVKAQGPAPKNNAEGHPYQQGRPGGMSPADWRAYNAATAPRIGPVNVKPLTDGLDAIKAHAAAASRSVEEIGPHAEQMSGRAVKAVQVLNNSSSGLDSVQAHAAAASRNIDQIGPHTQHATGVGIAAIQALDAALAARHEAKIYADTSQALINIRVMQQQVDALHGKTLMIRAIGGHVPGDPTGGGPRYNPNVAPPPTPGSQVGRGGAPGKAALFGARGAGAAAAGRQAGRSYMAGFLRGIADKSMTVQAAIGKIADAISKAKTKISNLSGIRAGFRSTFGADSIFGQDFSHTGPMTSTVNGVTTTGADVTTPGTISDVLAFQKQQRSKARGLAHDVRKVTSMGLSKALVRQLESQGAAGAATLHALAQGSPSQIRQLNALDRQTSASLRAAGMRAGNYVRGGSINADIANARKQEHVLELLEHHLKDLAHSEKKGETIIVNIDSEAVIKAVIRRNKRKGVKTAGL